MNIPSIKLRYFEKLKLWHDYLSPNSIFETQKKEYWKHEKVFLLWAFTPLHRHLYTSITTARILEIYSENGSNEFRMLKDYVNDDYARKLDESKKDIDKDNGKINYVKGNLDVEGFVRTTSEKNTNGYPETVRILPKGLLLGEIIFEAYSKDAKWYQKNFRYYRWGFWVMNVVIIIALLSLILVLLNQTIEIKEKIFNDASENNSIHRSCNNFGGHCYKFQR